MFKRRKPDSDARHAASAPRGRAAAGASAEGTNPLARRFLAESEPDTVDLAEPGRFHVPPADAEQEPDTQVTATAAEGRQALITLDDVTGKFYLHPGTDANPVRLNGAEVEAPTELRRGDRLRVGVHEFEFLA